MDRQRIRTVFTLVEFTEPTEVDDEQKEWEPGKMFVFDDMIRHSAYNGSDEERVLLMVDFYK